MADPGGELVGHACHRTSREPVAFAGVAHQPGVTVTRDLVARRLCCFAMWSHLDALGQRVYALVQRVVQQHELVVGGLAAGRLEAVECPLERAGECRSRRVTPRKGGRGGGRKTPEGTTAAVAISARTPVARLRPLREEAVETAVRERSTRSARP